MGRELVEAASLVAGASWPGTGPLVGTPHVAHEQPAAVSSAESRIPPTKIVLSRMLFLLVKRKTAISVYRGHFGQVSVRHIASACQGRNWLLVIRRNRPYLWPWAS